MPKPPLAALKPFLPPPPDRARLSDGELAKFMWAMGHRYADGCAEHVHRLLFEAAESLERRDG